jgi:hypothetical protein
MRKYLVKKILKLFILKLIKLKDFVKNIYPITVRKLLCIIIIVSEDTFAGMIGSFFK